MKKNLIRYFAASAAIVAALSVNAFACACCAERGTYIIRTAMPTAYDKSVFADMKFADSAELYMTAGEFEAIKGLDIVKAEYGAGTTGDFDLTQTYNNTGWKLTLKTPGGKTGTITLPRPAKFTARKIHFPTTGADEGEPVLTKEFSFTGTVAAGNGFLTSSNAKPTTYTLVFLGRGNICDNASDFTNWHLDITGPKASYSFFGKMKDAPAS